jgi:hypothetical protein
VDQLSGLAASKIAPAAMKDMKAHVGRLRDHAAECALLSAEAESKEKRELFAKLCADLTDAADQIESVINGAALSHALKKPDERLPH